MEKIFSALKQSEMAETLEQSIEYINTHIDEFEALLDVIFQEGGRTADKQQVLNIVDFLIPKMIVAVISRALLDADSQIRVRALQAAYRDRIDILNDMILEKLMDTNETFEVRKWAVHILATVGNSKHGRAIREITKDHTEDPALRKEAIFALTSIANSECIGTLCTMLGDPNPEIRAAGAWGLSRVRSPDSVICLLAALEDKDEEVRKWAIRALRDMNNVQALQGLANALLTTDPDEQVRMIQLLAEKRSEIIQRTITELLLSEDENVRRIAAWAAGVNPYPPAARNLEELLNDPDEQTRAYAKIALFRLGKIDPTDFRPTLE